MESAKFKILGHKGCLFVTEYHPRPYSDVELNYKIQEPRVSLKLVFNSIPINCRDSYHEFYNFIQGYFSKHAPGKVINTMAFNDQSTAYVTILFNDDKLLRKFIHKIITSL